LEYAGPAAHFLPAAGQYVSPHARPRAHDAHPDVHAYVAPQDEASLIREAFDRPLSPMFHRMANAVTAEAKIAEFHSIETQRAKYEECIRIKRAALEAMEIQVAEAKSTVSALRVEMEADEQGVETYKCILLPFLRKMAFTEKPMPSLNLLKNMPQDDKITEVFWNACLPSIGMDFITSSISAIADKLGLRTWEDIFNLSSKQAMICLF
jgi:hypothetical protein